MGWFEFFNFRKEPLRIKAGVAKQMVDLNQAVLIDVRTIEEFREKHIPKAILLPVYDVEKQCRLKLPDLNQNYIIYCRSGIRSKHAQDILKSLGYLHVFDLGGIIDWPYETISGV